MKDESDNNITTSDLYTRGNFFINMSRVMTQKWCTPIFLEY